MKSKQELFEEQLYTYNCGYWDSCWEHACPCNISVTCNGKYNEAIEKSLKEESRKVVDDMEDDFWQIPDYDSEDDDYLDSLRDDDNDFLDYDEDGELIY